MKLRIEYFVLGAVIVGLVLFLVLRTGNRVQYELPQIAEVKQDDVARITVEGPDETVVLERSGEEWTITPQGFPADASQARQMSAAIASFALTAVVSEAESYSRYDLDEGSRLRVTAYDSEGTQLIRFDVGKQGS